MNGFKQWVRAPEPKRQYFLLFAALLFVILLGRNLLLPTMPLLVAVLINLVSMVVAHAIAKLVIESRAKS